jgi:soluble lytic murein transglycosylase-like protein
MDSVRVQIKTIRPNLPDAPLGFYSVPWMNADAAPGPRYTCPPPGNLNAQIDRIATQEGVDSTLVREVVRQESAFDPCAVSPKGAAGLMQLMPRTQQQMHVSDAFDVVQNLTAGSRLLRQLLERYDGDIVSALAAYNAGPKKVDEAGGVPALAETRKYVNKILDRLPNR